MDLRTMLVERKTVVISAASGVIAGATIIVVLLANSSGQWRASGDGKTIFNSSTGEIRYTASGRSVAEIDAERRMEAKTAQLQQAEREKAREAQRVVEEQKRTAERLVEEQKRFAIFAHNSQIYRNLKKFVDDHPRITLPAAASPAETYDRAYKGLDWENVTRPFRKGYLLTREEHDTLLDFLGVAAVNEPGKSDPSFSQAIEELGKWEF
jgi:hypothetical protein